MSGKPLITRLVAMGKYHVFTFFLCCSVTSIVHAQENPWSSCIANLDYNHSPAGNGEIQILDKFDRDISNAGVALMDWEGFIDNPHFEFQIVPPANFAYPIQIEIRAAGAPRLYIMQRYRGQHPYDGRDFFSIHNETGPLWGIELQTLIGESILGGVSHDLSDEELEDIGLRRSPRFFGEEDFPLTLYTGIHPDRDGDDENYVFDIVITDASGNRITRELDVSVCDQDRPEREVEFQFHIDYSADFFGYLETTTDGLVVKEGFERILDDLAYFFTDMKFDEIEAGGCEAFVNWTVEDQPSTKTNSVAYDNGYYLFIASHSGGGGLSGDKLHTRNGEPTDFPACGFWGANPREQLSTNVNTRIYFPEDDWWRTTTHMQVFGKNGECLGDQLGDPGNGCIECPDDQEWCGHIRGDFYWPNLHELNHGLTLATDWPKWKEWFESEELCVDDDVLMQQVGTCLPMYKTDHVVTAGMQTESIKPADIGRTMFKRYDLLLMQAVGWDLRETTMLVELSIDSETLLQGNVGTEYQEQITISGGIPSYQFHLVSGSLPPGLALNSYTGAITGTATRSGTFEFTVELLDSDQYNVLRKNGVRKSFSVVIYE